jgi:hypothetical protein
MNAKIIFDIPNASELETIYSENPANLDEDSWYSWFDYCQSEPYAFMYINEKFKKGERIFKNFTHQCTWKKCLPNSKRKNQDEHEQREKDDKGKDKVSDDGSVLHDPSQTVRP